MDKFKIILKAFGLTLGICTVMAAVCAACVGILFGVIWFASLFSVFTHKFFWLGGIYAFIFFVTYVHYLDVSRGGKGIVQVRN